MSESNPFTALMNEGISDPISDNTKDKPEKEPNTALLERIFAFSLNEKEAKEKDYKYMGDLLLTDEKLKLDRNSLSYCLCERLFSFSDDSSELDEINSFTNHSRENKVIIYLYSCYKVYMDETLDQRDDYDFIKQEILKNTATAFINPEIYSGQNLFRQLLDVLMFDDFYSDFYGGLCEAIEIEDGNGE